MEIKIIGVVTYHNTLGKKGESEHATERGNCVLHKGLSFFSFTVQNMSPVKWFMFETLTKEHGLTEPAMVLHHMSLYTMMACVKTCCVCVCIIRAHD